MAHQTLLYAANIEQKYLLKSFALSSGVLALFWFVHYMLRQSPPLNDDAIPLYGNSKIFWNFTKSNYNVYG